MSQTPVARPQTRDAYPVFLEERLRFNDTDLVGHVNNAVFATLFESGRVEFLFDPKNPMYGPDQTFVLAKLNIDFLAELHYPGMVSIASGVARIGNSSVSIVQALFSGETCVGTAESVVVLIDATTRKATPLSAQTRSDLEARALR